MALASENSRQLVVSNPGGEGEGSSDLFSELSSSSTQVSQQQSNARGSQYENSQQLHRNNYNSVHGGMGPGYMSPMMQGGQMLMQTINAPVYFMGRLSQMLGMSFQSLHMSFASFVRLASMLLMLKNETAGVLRYLYNVIVRRLKRLFSSREQNIYADAWSTKSAGSSSYSWVISVIAVGVVIMILKTLYSWIFQSHKQTEDAITTLSKDKDLIRALTHREVLHMVSEVLQRRPPKSSNEYAISLLHKCSKPLQKLARSPQLLQAVKFPEVRKALTDIAAGRKPEISMRIRSWIIQCADLKKEGKDINTNQGTIQRGYGMGNMSMPSYGYGGYGYGMGSMGGMGYNGYGGFGGGYPMYM
mmetsp:Transcript_12700/g.19020  ORF Transcript_12700/g.19020 Transcript_12700/m.19020 type:complete len:359 (+) Transcript_12700:39-1115(+)